MTKNKGNKCSIADCSRIINKGGKGMCGLHYQRWKKHGDPLKTTKMKRPSNGLCSVQGCEQKYFGRGMCIYHYNHSQVSKEKKHKWGQKTEVRYRHLVKFNNKYYSNSAPLSFEEFQDLVNCPCTYCHLPLPRTSHGLDRIDNKRGYSSDNVLPCCGSCNRTRGDRFTVDETKVMISALMAFRQHHPITSR